VGISTSAPSCGSAASVTNTSVVVAVVWSQGKNFSTASSGGVGGRPGNDEMLNNKTTTNSNRGVFVDHVPAPSRVSGGEYDDQMVWIPAALLYSRLIAAGALP